MAITFLQYHQIDKLKWDACIDTAPNGLVYAYSFYLDTMAKNWNAIILNDYEAVMPLTYKKKYGIYYLYQPYFTAALGVFGKAISAAMVNDFLNNIPKKFKYWDIYFNHANRFTLSDFKLYERINYVLPLNDCYDNLLVGFKNNIKRNIKKSTQLNCVIKIDFDVEDVIFLAKEQSKNFAAINEEDYDNFKKVYWHFYQQKKAITYGICTPAGKLMASAAFLFSHGRAYYILVGNHPNSKTYGASHALINTFIKNNAEQNLLLDFEGSDIQSLAFFYSSFGAREEKFAGIKYNKLPFYIRWFKK